MVDRDITSILEGHIPSTVHCIKQPGMVIPNKPDREDVKEIIKELKGLI
jgi:hypothetical protein